MQVNRRFINVMMLIIFGLSFLAVLGCDNSGNEARITDLKNRVSTLKSQLVQLNQEFNTAKQNQGWFRNNVLPDNAEVKAFREKIKIVESEIAATEKELATLTGNSGDGISEQTKDSLLSTIEILGQRVADRIAK